MAVALASAFVRVRPQTDKAAFRKDGEAAGDEAAAGFEKGWKRGADGKVRDAQGRFVPGFGSAGEKAGRAAAKGFGKGFGDGGSSIFATVAKVMSARIAVIGVAAAAATPAVLKLTAALVPASGALLAVPSAMGAIKLASATVQIAVAGVSDAIGEGLTGSAEKAEKALKELPAPAAAFAREVIRLRPQVEALRTVVSGRFFKPFIDDVRPLAEVYFPLLRRQMGDLAGPLGGIAEQFTETARTAQAIQTVNSLFYNTRIAVINLRFAIAPLGEALFTILGQTNQALPTLAQGVTNLAVRFNNFVQRAAEGGGIFRAYQNGIATLKDLGGIVRNVGSIFVTVIRVASETSGSLLANMRALTGQAAEFVRSAQGLDALRSVFSTLASLSAGLRTTLGAVLPAVGQSLQILGPAIAGLAQPVATLVVALAPVLPMLAGSAAIIIKALTPAIAALSEFLAENTTLVKAAVIAYGTWLSVMKVSAAFLAVNAAGGLAAYIKQMTIVTNLTKVWTGVQLAFNAVMALNPFVLVVAAIAAFIAILVVAYKRSETFRRIVDAAWAGIKTAVKVSVDWIVGTAWPAIKRVFDGIADAAMWLWRNAILPAWNGIRAAVDFVVGAVKGYIRLLVAEFRIIANVATWLWQNIFAPVFRGIAKVVEVWWLAVRVVFQFLANIIRTVVIRAITNLRDFFVSAFNFIRNNVITPWWNNVRAIFNLFRLYILGPIVQSLTRTRNFFTAVFRAIIATIRNWWAAHVQPVLNLARAAWTALATSFRRTYDSSIRPLFQRFVDFIRNNVVRGFTNATNMIKAAWDKVREYARKPVAFVVTKVINPFINGLNSAAKIVGIDDRIATIGGFARGGQIPGTPSNRDNRVARSPNGMLAVASGEFITNTRSTLANLDLVKAINAKRGKVTHDDVDPYLDGARHGGHVGYGVGDGFGDFFNKLKKGFTGAINLITNPKEALQKVANAALSKIPGSGLLKNFVKGGANKIIRGAIDWLTNFGGGALGGGNGPEGWRAKRAIIANWFPQLKMISGPRPGARTLSGNRSLHADGLAVDYPAFRPLAARIKALFGRSTQELITPWQELNLLHGRPHRFTGAVWRQHNFAGGNAHVHWGAELGGLIDKLSGAPVPVFDSGGTLRPGFNTVYNGLGRPEHLKPTRRRPATPTEPTRLHPADIEAIAVALGRVMAAAIGGSNYAAGRQTNLYTRAG